jgi:hypothetical protein
MLTSMNRNKHLIEQDVATIVFYMQGSIQYDDAWLLSPNQRKLFGHIIEKHYEKLSGAPGRLI